MTYFLKTISPEGKISLKALAGKQTTVLKATGQMRYEVVDEAGNVLQPELQNGSAQWLAADGQPALIVENYTPMAMSEAANPALNPALKETVQASEVAAVGSGVGVGKIALGVLGLAGIGAALGGGGGGGGGGSSSAAPASNNQAGSNDTPISNNQPASNHASSSDNAASQPVSRAENTANPSASAPVSTPISTPDAAPVSVSNNQAASSKTPVIRFDAITGDNVIDKAESQQQNITISGTVEHANEGDTLVLLVGDGKFSGTVQGGKFSIAVNGSNLANHESIRAEIKAADQTKAAADHRYTRVFDPSLSLEQITGDNRISRKESQGKITIKGVAKNIADGTEINVVCGCPLCSGSSKTATVQAGSFSVDFEGATLLANGHHTITAKLMNAPEGEASPVASQKYTTEALPDLQWDEIGTNDIINANTANTVTLSGSILNLKTGDKAAVSVKIGSETLNATVENNRFSVNVEKSKFAGTPKVEAVLTVTHPEDGTITDTEARPYLYDVNVGTPTVTVDQIDTINHAKSLGNVHLSGSVQTDADVAQVKVIVTVNGTEYTASVSNGRWTLDINGSLLTQTQGQNSLSVRAEATDKAGNTASGSQTATYNVDTQAPIATISFNEIAEIPADGNGKTTVSGTVSGEFSADGVVTLTANGQTFQAKIGASGAFSQEIDNSHLRNDNSISASLELVDAVGNRNVASKTSSYSVKAVTPPTESETESGLGEGGSGDASAGSTVTPPSTQTTPETDQNAGGQDASSTTTPAEDTPKGSNSSATGSNAGSGSSTANGQTDGQGGESPGAETKPNTPQPSQPTSPAAGSDAAGKDGATGSTASGSGDAGTSSAVTPPSTQTTPPAVEKPKTPEGNQAVGGEGADTKPAAGTGESSGNQAGDSKTEDSSSTQTPPEAENPKTPENNQNAGGQGAGSTTTPATGTPNGSQTPPAEEKPTTPETNQGDSGQDSSSSATTPTTGTPQGGGSTNNAEGSGGQGTGTKPAAGTSDSQAEDNQTEGSQGEDSQDASGSSSAATPATGTPNGSQTPPAEEKPTTPETNQGGSGQSEGAGSGTQTQPNAGSGNANDAAAGGSSGNTTPPTTEQPVPPAPPAPTPPAAGSGTDSAADTDTDDEDAAEDNTEETGTDAANPNTDAPPAVPPAIAPRSLANTILAKPSTPKAPKPEIRLDDFHDKLSSEKAALDDSFIVARGTVNLPGVFGKYKNPKLLSGISIKIGEKSYKASFDPETKQFEALIDRNDLPSLEGQAITYTFEKSGDTVYDIEMGRYGGYDMKSSYAEHVNHTHLVHHESSPLRSGTFRHQADSLPTVSATPAPKVTLTGTVKNAQDGDKIEVKVGDQIHETTINNNAFSLEVDKSLLNNVDKVTASLKRNGNAAATAEHKHSEAEEVSANFVTKHEHISVGKHDRPYFITSLMKKSTEQGIDYKLYHQDQDTFDAGVTSTFKYRFATPKQYTNQRHRTEDDKKAIKKALDSMSDTANVNFVEDTDGTQGGVNYYMSDAKPTTKYGEAAYGGEVTIYNHHHILHDRMVNTIIHETFHSLGLKHANSTEGSVIPTAEDDRSISVMSVNHPWSGKYKPEPSIYDLAFLHYRFGVRPTKRAESNVYKFKAVNESTIDRDVYIWDGAGVDTFDASDQKQAVTVNLTPGSWIHSGAKTDNFLIGGNNSSIDHFEFFGKNKSTDFFSSTMSISGFDKYNVGQAFIGYGTQIEKLIGSDHNDTLSGNKAGNHIWGGKGDDTIFGDDGNDYLDGGAGNDTLKGGLGDDIFVVDSTGDVVVEQAGEGTDTVHAYVSYTLPDNVEKLILYGSSDINATGNGENNTLIGNDANNRLEGGAGVDTLTGNRGDDIFVISDIATADTITDFNVNDDKIGLARNVFGDVTDSNIRERIQYDSADGKLYYQSASGSAATHFATVSTGLVLDESHFILV